ncbi:hypothetical protein WJX73_003620 [Symbiochloris irregularis]|uniref:Flavin-containing monooxygenase n=1 Tax=Symbiochloris irregularis TaxID=706552 RepID=A0AAW1NRA4_9CHLO
MTDGRKNSGVVEAASIPTDASADSARQTAHAVVIGAGAAGLVAARELLREGHQVTVLESGSDEVGGVWAYTDEVESDQLGVRPKKRIHSSMYRDLRTNLPRQVMAYADFPFTPEAMKAATVDSRVYPSHQEVLAYLQAFSDAYQLKPHIRWRVSFMTGQQGQPEQPATPSHIETDAVVVCNGHYSDPFLPDIPGMDTFPGKQLHTHNYRSNEAFAGKRVCLVGAQASGIDISQEIAAVAQQVWVCSRKWPETVSVGEPHAILQLDNLIAMPPPEQLHSDGDITFQDGSRVNAVDVVVYATGYHYSYPFLDAACGVTVGDNRVAPVYKHTLVPHFGPTLSFLGLPFKVAPFPLFEAQARWVARALSRRISLPSVDEMTADIQAWEQEVQKRNWPLRYTHMTRVGQHA